MGKKYKERSQNSPQEGASVWDQIEAAKQQMGMETKTQGKPREEEDNKYKNYDPEKESRKRKSQKTYRGENVGNRNRESARTGQMEGRETNTVHKVPLDIAPHAPYNFVRFSDKVLEVKEERIPSLNQIGADGLYTGYISYGMTAQTPIFTDGGNKEFYRDKNGRCAIPGSTMRGLIRNNLQNLSFSGFHDDIDDYRLMYRAVADGCLKDEYNNMLGSEPNPDKPE